MLQLNIVSYNHVHSVNQGQAKGVYWTAFCWSWCVLLERARFASYVCTAKAVLGNNLS